MKTLKLLAILWSCIGATLIAGSASQGVSEPLLAVDWHTFLSREDPFWTWDGSTAPAPKVWYEGSFIGNGDLGAMLYADTPQSLRMDLGRQSVWDDRYPGSAEYMGNFVFDRPRL
jgi:hypothetical protein